MRTMQTRPWSGPHALCVALALVAIDGAVLAQIPCGPDAPLHENHVNALNEHFRVTLVEAGGHTSPGPRRQFLEALRDQMLNRAAPGEPKELIQRALSQLVEDAGSGEPLIEFGRGFTHVLKMEWSAARARLEPSIDDLMRTDVGVNVKAAAAEAFARTLEQWPGDRARSAEWSERARQLRVESLTSGVYRSVGLRVAHAEIKRVALERLGVEDLSRLYDAMRRAPGVDPWLLDTLGGAYHIEAAWGARGGGWAYTVTPRGWQGFAEHLLKAEECLLRAHALHLERPEAAANLITVAMGQGAAGGKDARYWFDQAVKADFDWMVPYTKLIYALRPRWGGSLEQVYDFGLECLNTKRFDTAVPAVLGWALCKIAEDVGWEWDFLNERELYPLLKDLYERSAALAKTRDTRNRYRTRHLAFARHAGQWHEAYGILQNMQLFEVDREALSELGIYSNQELFTDVIAHRLLPSEDLAECERMVKEKRFADVVGILKRMQASMSQSPLLQRDARGRQYVERFFRRELQSNQWLAQLDAGEWVDITPTDRDLFGWRALQGNWTHLPGGAGVIGRSAPISMMLICDTPFGNRFTVEARVPFQRRVVDYEPNAGLVIYFDDEKQRAYDMLLYYPQSGEATVTYGLGGMVLSRQRAIPTAPGEAVTLIADCWDGLLVARINGQAFYAGESAHAANSPTFKIGIGAAYGLPERSATFQSIRVRKLLTPPVELEQALVERHRSGR